MVVGVRARWMVVMMVPVFLVFIQMRLESMTGQLAVWVASNRRVHRWWMVEWPLDIEGCSEYSE